MLMCAGQHQDRATTTCVQGVNDMQVWGFCPPAAAWLSLLQAKMDRERLLKQLGAGAVRTGGKGSVRRKKASALHAGARPPMQ